MTVQKRLVSYPNAGYYQVLSAEVNTKHGLNVSGLVFDELHSLPTRALYDVLTKGASDAKFNPLAFIITTAGTDKNSIGYEVHMKARGILDGQRGDPTFYLSSTASVMRTTGRMSGTGIRQIPRLISLSLLTECAMLLEMQGTIRRKRTCSGSSGSTSGLLQLSAGYRSIFMSLETCRLT